MIDMMTTDAIMNFATKQISPFKRRELLAALRNDIYSVPIASAVTQLNRLVSAGKLIHIGQGLYSIPDRRKHKYYYQPNKDLTETGQFIRQHFPFVEFCIWQPSAFIPFMQHVPNVGMTLVDVERDGMESVFLSLQQEYPSTRILLNPSVQECERYITNEEQLIIRPLVKEAPINIIDGCPVPKIEKMLVDALGDKEIQFVQGAELYTIYQNAFEQYDINCSSLLRYASRRNRKNKVEQILDTIDHDTSRQ
jgi:hypothetical protein